jgi:hypothetical protein
MSGALSNLVLQLIGGVIGGVAACAVAGDFTIGQMGSVAVGALGGVGGGSLLTAFNPDISMTPNGLDAFVVTGQLLGGGLSGAIATILVGLIMSARKKM